MIYEVSTQVLKAADKLKRSNPKAYNKYVELIKSLSAGKGIPIIMKPRPLTNSKGLCELNIASNLRVLFIKSDDKYKLLYIGNHDLVEDISRRHKGNGVFSNEAIRGMFNFLAK